MRKVVVVRWFIAPALLVLSACQLFNPPGAALRSAEQAGFMDLWKVYNHCRAAQDPEAVLLDALLLQRAVSEKAYVDVPKVLRPIRKLIEPLPARLAADPRAMAASCTLRAAELAGERGWSDLALQIYTAMIPAYQSPEYAYYLQQARSGLSQTLEAESKPGTSASTR